MLAYFITIYLRHLFTAWLDTKYIAEQQKPFLDYVDDEECLNDQEVAGGNPARSTYPFVGIDLKIFSTFIVSFPMILEGQLSISCAVDCAWHDHNGLTGL